ncbi:MAG: 30S ribosomal protein S20 [Candidatus Dormibacteraeota bacterium]|nr:30S ribosomal protein S20 [Candidatus Dormibacteraeota bacterium]
MANTRSARRRIRSSERKRLRNRAVRSSVRTKVTKARRALLGVGAAAETEQDLRAAIRSLDRAAEKGILHRNNARRRKSRLARMAARLASVAQGGESEQAAARAAAAGGAKGRSTKPAARKAAAKPAGKAAAKAPAPRAAAAKSPRAKKA